MIGRFLPEGLYDEDFSTEVLYPIEKYQLKKNCHSDILGWQLYDRPHKHGEEFTLVKAAFSVE